jgi:hypothetical protein
MPNPTRLSRIARSAPPILLCALAGHGAAYGTLKPHDEAHGYFQWYEAAVGLASGIAILVLAALLVCAACGFELPPRLRRVLGFNPPRHARSRAFSLAASALGLLLFQELLEHAVSEGRVDLAALSLREWAVAACTALAAALLLSLLARAYRTLRSRLLGTIAATPRRAPSAAVWVVLQRGAARRNPLADHFGVRAPPLALS